MKLLTMEGHIQIHNFQTVEALQQKDILNDLIVPAEMVELTIFAQIQVLEIYGTEPPIIPLLKYK